MRQMLSRGFGELRHPSTVSVTIVDQHNFHTFSPLLYQVATAGLAPDDIAPNVRGIVQGSGKIEPRMARVVGVDCEQRRVIVEDDQPIRYDYLVLAAGSVSSDFGVPGVSEHTIPLKTLRDATRVRSTVLRRFEQATANPAFIEQGALRVVVAGGGPTGVELSGALAERVTKVLVKDFKNLDLRRAEVVLVEATGAVLGTFSPSSQAEAARELEARGVRIRVGVAIASVDAEAVHLADGTSIASRTVVRCEGVKANPLADSLGLRQTKRGEIVVNDDLTIPGHPHVFVVGDLAAPDRKSVV